MPCNKAHSERKLSVEFILSINYILKGSLRVHWMMKDPYRLLKGSTANPFWQRNSVVGFYMEPLRVPLKKT